MIFFNIFCLQFLVIDSMIDISHHFSKFFSYYILKVFFLLFYLFSLKKKKKVIGLCVTYVSFTIFWF